MLKNCTKQVGSWRLCTEDVLLQPWLGVDYCVAVFLCNQLNELPDGPVQHSAVTDPNIQTADGQNIKKAPMPWEGVGGDLNITTQTTHSEMKT